MSIIYGELTYLNVSYTLYKKAYYFNMEGGDSVEKFDMLNQPIRISDAASMLRHCISPNERPYKASVMRENNKLIDEWHDKVLKTICDKRGMVRAGQVYPEWEYFYNGKMLKKFHKSFI